MNDEIATIKQDQLNHNPILFYLFADVGIINCKETSKSEKWRKAMMKEFWP